MGALITSLDKYTTVRVELSPSSVKPIFCFIVFSPEVLQKWDSSDLRAETLGGSPLGSSEQTQLLNRNQVLLVNITCNE